MPQIINWNIKSLIVKKEEKSAILNKQENSVVIKWCKNGSRGFVPFLKVVYLWNYCFLPGINARPHRCFSYYHYYYILFFSLYFSRIWFLFYLFLIYFYAIVFFSFSFLFSSTLFLCQPCGPTWKIVNYDRR